MKSNGEIEKFKARICVLGFRQKQGLDFNPDQVYAPMTEPTTIRLLLAIANKLLRAPLSMTSSRSSTSPSRLPLERQLNNT